MADGALFTGIWANFGKAVDRQYPRAASNLVPYGHCRVVRNYQNTTAPYPKGRARHALDAVDIAPTTFRRHINGLAFSR